jgi:hypothetical protein
MSSRLRHVGRAMAGAAMLVVAALPAVAQEAQPAEPPSSSPSRVVLEPVESGVVFVPDVRFGSVNERTATFVGGHAGWLSEQTFLVGAGGYWLANRDDDFRMAYGGAVVEWRLRGTERLAFGTRALVGGGAATLGGSVAQLRDIDGPVIASTHAPEHRFGPGPGTFPAVYLVVDETFFVFEPQANVTWRLARWLALNAGVGYRLVAGADFLDDELRGVSGNIGLQFGSGQH